MTRLFAIIFAAALVVMLAATWWVSTGRVGDDIFADCRRTAIAGGTASIGGPFTLVNGQGQTVTDSDVITRPTLIYFGYTFCPDICPLDADRNAKALDLLIEQGHDVQAAFISIDPERDTPEVIGEYAEYRHERMIGLTGSAEQVAAASRAYRTFYSKDDTGDEYYLMSHTTFTYLVFPQLGFVEFFKRDDSAADLATSTACFIARA